MSRRTYLSLAIIIGIASVLYAYAGIANGSTTDVLSHVTPRLGRNNTVLILTNSEHGLSNVLLATGNALVNQHPDVEVHMASFKNMEKRVARVSKFAKRKIQFHTFDGKSYVDAIGGLSTALDEAILPPGLKGSEGLARNLQMFMMPWTGHEYLDLYFQVDRLLNKTDPSVVVIETFLGPAFDAARMQGRKYVVITPNSLKDNIGTLQPMAQILWKFPALGSGFTFPVPLHLIPVNIYLSFRMLYSMIRAPGISDKRRYLHDKGLPPPTDFTSVCPRSPLCITQGLPEAEYPLSFIPDNVKACGPIFVSSAPVSQQDSAMAEWLARAPTILVNLGSLYSWDERAASEMAQAIKLVFAQSDVQVLWKIQKRHDFSDEFLADLVDERKSGRLRVEDWIKVDPGALLESGHIVLSVHHGGANCYFEAIANGIPQVILAHWIDLYDFAVRAEYIGVGIWGNKREAPLMFADELGSAMLKPLGNSTESIEMRQKAKNLGEIARARGGRNAAAAYVAEMARVV